MQIPPLEPLVIQSCLDGQKQKTKQGTCSQKAPRGGHHPKSTPHGTEQPRSEPVRRASLRRAGSRTCSLRRLPHRPPVAIINISGSTRSQSKGRSKSLHEHLSSALWSCPRTRALNRSSCSRSQGAGPRSRSATEGRAGRTAMEPASRVSPGPLDPGTSGT